MMMLSLEKPKSSLTFDLKVWPHLLGYQIDFARNTLFHQSAFAPSNIKICQPIIKLEFGKKNGPNLAFEI